MVKESMPALALVANPLPVEGKFDASLIASTCSLYFYNLKC